MLYRLFKPGDFDALYAIETACFQPPLRFTRRYLRSVIDASSAATWVAENDAQPIGFAVLEWFENGPEVAAYLQTIEVLPAYRSRGVATELLRRVEASALDAHASESWLHVDATNSNAIRLYEKHSFTLQGRKDHYYGQGTQGLIYRKVLSQERGTRLPRTP
jgi:ribosomal protein S18 acetylase RimI-like enzyme